MFRIGKYHTVVYSGISRGVELADAKELEALSEDIDWLGSLMAGSGFDWFLVGGVGLYLANGGFARKHGDFDIEIDFRDFQKASEHLAERGYAVTRRIMSANLPGRRKLMVLKEENDLESAVKSSKIRAICAANGIGESMAMSRRAYIDIHVAVHNGLTVSTSNGFVFSESEYANEATHTTNSGYAIMLRNPKIAIQMKLARCYENDAFDLERITGQAVKGKSARYCPEPARL